MGNDRKPRTELNRASSRIWGVDTRVKGQDLGRREKEIREEESPKARWFELPFAETSGPSGQLCFAKVSALQIYMFKQSW